MERNAIKIFTILILLILATSNLFACSSKESKMEKVNYISVNGDEAKKMMDSIDKYIILDVRSLEEYDDFHIENAIHIPDYEIEVKAPSILLDKDEPIFVYCRSGRRSKTASKQLAKMGYTNIIEFGGVINWHYGFVTEQED